MAVDDVLLQRGRVGHARHQAVDRRHIQRLVDEDVGNPARASRGYRSGWYHPMTMLRSAVSNRYAKAGVTGGDRREHR
jgi:hypothetical protein